MPRLILLEILVFLSAFGVSYLFRLVLGRRIGGPPVILWGAIFGMIGAMIASYVVENTLEGTRFLWTDGNIWGILAIAFQYFLLTALIGGVLGALIASLPRGKRRDHTQGAGRNSGQPPTK
jgi:energy-converting hydrogenase Eha subunit A